MMTRVLEGIPRFSSAPDGATGPTATVMREALEAHAHLNNGPKPLPPTNSNSSVPAADATPRSGASVLKNAAQGSASVVVGGRDDVDEKTLG